MKEAFYFPHDYNAKNDQKVLILRGDFWLEWYALFFMILESMAEETDGYINRVAIGGLSVSYGVAKDTLIAVIEKCIEIGLFLEDEHGIFSKRMIEHKNYRKTLSEQGKMGAEKRWKNSPPISPPNAKERKGKEIKENNNTDTNDVYMQAWHLSISHDEFTKLEKEFWMEKADELVQSVLNYRKNSKYKSLYLTAQKWGRAEKKKAEAPVKKVFVTTDYSKL